MQAVLCFAHCILVLGFISDAGGVGRTIVLHTAGYVGSSSNSYRSRYVC
jgi:hypothetical protein